MLGLNLCYVHHGVDQAQSPQQAPEHRPHPAPPNPFLLTQPYERSPCCDPQALFPHLSSPKRGSHWQLVFSAAARLQGFLPGARARRCISLLQHTASPRPPSTVTGQQGCGARTGGSRGEQEQAPTGFSTLKHSHGTCFCSEHPPQRKGKPHPEGLQWTDSRACHPAPSASPKRGLFCPKRYRAASLGLDFYNLGVSR